jgi:small subunit ribosomal protein S17
MAHTSLGAATSGLKALTEGLVRNKPVLATVVRAHQMEKTVVVHMIQLKKHPKFHRQIRHTTKLLVHDESGECEVGDRVYIQKSRRYSKRKAHKVVRVARPDPAHAFLKEYPQYKKTNLQQRVINVERGHRHRIQHLTGTQLTLWQEARDERLEWAREKRRVMAANPTLAKNPTLLEDEPNFPEVDQVVEEYVDEQE